MKKIIFIIGLIAGAMLFWSCEEEVIDLNVQKENEVSQKNAMIDYKSKLQNKEFISESLFNNVIGNDSVRKMQVYTPPGYDHKRAEGYPVVYLLHGLPFTEKSFIDIHTWDQWIDPDGIFKNYPEFPEEGFRLWADNLIATGKMEPSIIVMPDASSAYGFSMYSNSILNGNFEDYIVYDLVNFMDKRYNTIANRDGRAVIGFSQGGYAAFKFGMKHPDIFGAVASHSGLIMTDHLLNLGEYIMGENWDGSTFPDPSTQFLNYAGLAMSAAWSPNLSNPPFYVDMVMEPPSPLPIPAVRALWLEQDVFTMLDDYHEDFNSLKGIYLDLGAYDEFGLAYSYPYLIQKLDGYGVDYTYGTYLGGHYDEMFSRLAISLEYCSDALQE